MTPEQRQQIITWLSSPRDYDEGVALYGQHGLNKMYKRRFAAGANQVTRQLLTDELRRMAGLTVAELAVLPRLAYGVAATTGQTGQADRTDRTDRADQCGQPTVSPVTRFRERWPFLYEPDCPDELKIIVSDMISAYGRYKEARQALAATPDSDYEAAAAAAEATIEYFLTDREIEAELVYYRDNHRILGQCAYFRRRAAASALQRLTDLELRGKLTNARSNVSKWRGKLKAAEAAGGDTAAAMESLDKWTTQLEAIEAETEDRKKKLTAN